MDCLEILALVVYGRVTMVRHRLHGVFGMTQCHNQGLQMWSQVALAAKASLRAIQALISAGKSPALTSQAEGKRLLEASVKGRGNGHGR